MGCGLHQKVRAEHENRQGMKPRAAKRVAVVYSLLQRMHGDTRREVIQNSMRQKERLALEMHIVALKKAQDQAEVKKATTTAPKSDNLALCDTDSSESSGKDSTVQKGKGGICKSADGDRVYGYYAKVAFNKLIFVGRIHAQLEDAVQDHIVLSKICEVARYDCEDVDFPARVRLAINSVLADEGTSATVFFRSVAVVCSAHHWVGRCLSVFFGTVESALEAWHCFDRLQTPRLFEGGCPTANYTPQRAMEQWAQMKEVFLSFQAVRGPGHRAKVAERVARMEAQHRPLLAKKFNRWAQRQQKGGSQHHRKNAAKVQEAILYRFWTALGSWRRDAIAEERQRVRAQVAAAKAMKRQRWDGKESLHDYNKRRKLGGF